MSELVVFLRARIDEDEAWAHNPECDQDPDRLLREVEAKRRQIDLALALIEQETGHPGATLMMRQAGEDMLRTMAAIHRDHEDYSEDLPL